MTDPESPPPSMPAAEPLGYYHGPRGSARPVALGVSLTSGLILGAVAVTAVGVACGFMTFEAPKTDPTVRLAAVAFAVATAASAAGTAFFVRRGRRLESDARGRNGRFFLLGLLIGCGVGALGQGICFGIAATNG